MEKQCPFSVPSLFVLHFTSTFSLRYGFLFCYFSFSLFNTICDWPRAFVVCTFSLLHYVHEFLFKYVSCFWVPLTRSCIYCFTARCRGDASVSVRLSVCLIVFARCSSGSRPNWLHNATINTKVAVNWQQGDTHYFVGTLQPIVSFQHRYSVDFFTLNTVQASLVDFSLGM